MCHSCGASSLRFDAHYPSLHRVTSDCKPWPAGGQLAWCTACGLAQAAITPQWRAEADQIYANYTIYHQSGGSEQRVFGTGGAGLPRSEQIVAGIRRVVEIPETGRLLDVGCGNGAFLTAWSRQLPRWSLAGSEVSDANRQAVESIPGVERLHTGPLAGIPGRFTAISLIHVLEHIPSPIAFLSQLREKLEPGGLLILEVPDCAQNPFILLVADHSTHFTPATASVCAAAAGFEVVAATGDWVAKEVSVVGRWTPSVPPQGRAMEAGEADAARVLAGARLLHEARTRVLPQLEAVEFGIFGTAIGATWFDAESGRRARFFVDEDETRIGKTHLGRPILLPAEVPMGSTVVVPLAPAIAGGVLTRLRALGRQLKVITI